MKKYTIKYCFHGSFIEVECDDFEISKVDSNNITQIPIVKDEGVEKDFQIQVSEVLSWQVTENSYYPDSYEEKWKMAKEIIDEVEKHFKKEYEKHGNYEEPLGKDEFDIYSTTKTPNLSLESLAAPMRKPTKEEKHFDYVLIGSNEYDITQKDIYHLKFIRNRMASVHGEELQTDYMLKFQEIIEKLEMNQPLPLKKRNLAKQEIEDNTDEAIEKALTGTKVVYYVVLPDDKEDRGCFTLASSVEPNNKNINKIIYDQLKKNKIDYKYFYVVSAIEEKYESTVVKGDINPGEDMTFKKVTSNYGESQDIMDGCKINKQTLPLKGTKDRKQIEKHLKIAYEAMENIKSLLKSSGFKL